MIGIIQVVLQVVLGIASLLLTLLILLHRGRGGGLSDMFGGVAGSSLAGSTVVERNLDRMTVIVALIFMFTTILLSMRLG